MAKGAEISQRCGRGSDTKIPLYASVFVIYLYSLIFWICCAFKIHNSVILGKILYKKNNNVKVHINISPRQRSPAWATLVCGKQADILGGTTASDNTNSLLLSYIHTAIVDEG